MRKSKLFPKLAISMPSLLFWLAVAVFDRTMQTAAMLCATLSHELGHVIAMRLCGMRIVGFTVFPYGLEFTADRRAISFSEDIAVNSAGCAVNLLSFPVLYTLGAVIHGEIGAFLNLTAVSSITLGILNALPIISLDGGCALEAFLSLILSPDTAYRTVKAVSFIFLIGLWVAATYVFMFSGYNYSLFAMAIWLFARIFLPPKK